MKKLKKSELIVKLNSAVNRLCYTCKNGNASAKTKHSKSCDICPWKL